MVLSDRDIKKALSSKRIVITPAPDLDTQLGSCSIDLRLGDTFRVFDHSKYGHIDPAKKDYSNEITKEIRIEDGGSFIMQSGEFVLAVTLENVKIPNDLMAVLYPRSSTNRKGLSLDLTGIIDSGYEGQLTLPIRNNTHSQAVRLYPGERMCQVVFEELKESVKARKSKYHKKDIVDGITREKHSEANLIMKGDIRKLKSEFSVVKSVEKK